MSYEKVTGKIKITQMPDEVCRKVNLWMANRHYKHGFLQAPELVQKAGMDESKHSLFGEYGEFGEFAIFPLDLEKLFPDPGDVDLFHPEVWAKSNEWESLEQDYAQAYSPSEVPMMRMFSCYYNCPPGGCPNLWTDYVIRKNKDGEFFLEWSPSDKTYDMEHNLPYLNKVLTRMGYPMLEGELRGEDYNHIDIITVKDGVMEFSIENTDE